MRNAIKRRRFLSAVGATGAIGLAGCMGGGGGGPTRVTMGTAGEGSSTFRAAQGLQRALSQNSDSVRLDSQTTQGYVANARAFDQGQFNAVGLDNYTAVQAQTNSGPYSEQPINNIPMLGLQFSIIDMYPMAVDGSGIETSSDLEGSSFWPIGAGNATRLISEDVLREAGIWSGLNIVEMSGDDLPGALEQGTIDAFMADPSGHVDSLPGTLQEIDSRFSVHAVDVEDNLAQAAQNLPGVGYREIGVNGWQQNLGVDQLRTWTLNGQFWFGDQVSNDAVYEICRVSHEHNASIRDADPAYLDHSNIENMTSAFTEDFAVHPGAANFYQENNAWNDAWQVGGDQSDSGNQSSGGNQSGGNNTIN